MFTIKNLLILVLITVIAIRLSLSFIYPPPATIEEGQLSVFSQNIFKNFDQVQKFNAFGEEKGYFLFAIPTLIIKLFSIISGYSYISGRIINQIIIFISGVVFSYIFSRLLDIKNKNRTLAFLIFLTLFSISPWNLVLSTFYFSKALSLLFLSLSILFFSKNHYISVFFMTLVLLTSIEGLILGIALFTILLISRQRDILLKPGWVYIPVTLLILILLFKNQSFVKSFISNPQISQFSSKNLSNEINERQKIDFLSTDKKYLLPAVVRKYTYNKVFLSSEKIVNHLVSFFDIELLSFPQESYEIIKLSGISPKGNLQLLYIWEIPIILAGMYILSKNTLFDINTKRLLLFFSIAAFIPFLFFEKKLTSQSSYFLTPIFIFLEGIAIWTAIDGLKQSRSKFVLILSIPLCLYSFIQFSSSMFLYPKSYQTPDLGLYKQISLWIVKNKPNKQIFVTSRFGPTSLMYTYYTSGNISDFWANYLQNSLKVNIKSAAFLNFDLKNSLPESNSIYIGLPGDFVGKGKNLENKDLKTGLKVTEKIYSDDEPVFEYGKNIWIVYSE